MIPYDQFVGPIVQSYEMSLRECVKSDLITRRNSFQFPGRHDAEHRFPAINCAAAALNELENDNGRLLSIYCGINPLQRFTTAGFITPDPENDQGICPAFLVNTNNLTVRTNALKCWAACNYGSSREVNMSVTEPMVRTFKNQLITLGGLILNCKNTRILDRTEVSEIMRRRSAGSGDGFVDTCFRPLR